MTYRILFAPDGEHWIDHRCNNRRDPSQAVLEAREFLFWDEFARVKVVNTQTKAVVYQGKGAKVQV